jgi:hypothetical protein
MHAARHEEAGMPIVHHTRVFSFLSLVALLAGLELWISRSPWFLPNASLLALAITVDLTLGIPLLYYLVFVRPRRVAPMTLAPVCIASVVLAQQILPAAQHAYLAYVAVLVPVLEALVLLGAVLKARRVVQYYRRVRPTTVYASDALEASIRHSFGASPWVAVLVTELSLPYYVVYGWFHRFTPTQADQLVLPYHRTSGYGAVVGLLTILIGLETLGFHLLIQHWSAPLAWSLTLLSLYSLLWIMGDYHAARLHPIILTPEQVHIRTGLRWRIDVAWTAIAAVQMGMPRTRLHSYVNAAVYGEPQLVLHLKEPVMAYGILGMRKSVRHIGLTVDDPRRFHAEVTQRLQE